jgi:hypothetical protein
MDIGLVNFILLHDPTMMKFVVGFLFATAKNLCPRKQAAQAGLYFSMLDNQFKQSS